MSKETYRHYPNSIFSQQALAKERATAARQKVIYKLDKYLVDFESGFKMGKGSLHWTNNANSAFQLINDIIPNDSRIFCDEHPILDEIELSRRLGNRSNLNQCEKEQEASIFIGGLYFMLSEEVAAFTRDFAISAFDKIILFAGIDQFLASVDDLHLFNHTFLPEGEKRQILNLQNLPNVHLVFLDNGRSELLGKSPQNQLLLFGFPSFYNHRDNLPFLNRLFHSHLGENNPHDVCQAYTLDGFAENDLALSIPLHDIVIADREENSEERKSESDLIWRTWKSAMLKRKILNRSRIGPISLMKSFYKRGYGTKRSFPKTEKGNFTERWVKERPVTKISQKLTDVPKGKLLVRKPATDGRGD